MSRERHPATLATAALLLGSSQLGAPVAAADGEVLAVELGKRVTETGVSGRRGQPRVLGEKKSETAALTGLFSMERADHPCWVQVTTETVADDERAGKPEKDLCGPRGPRERSLLGADFADRDATGERAFVSGIDVCLNAAGTRVKGWRLYGRRITRQGRLEDLENHAIAIPRANCASWQRRVDCPVGQLATAAKVFFGEGDEPRDWVGVSLWCRELSTVLALTGTGKDVATGKRGLSSLVTVSHEHPDGVREERKFRYSTPVGFSDRPDRSVNLWIVFHGGDGTPDAIHDFFDEIPHESPTLLVYPRALAVDVDNDVIVEDEADADEVDADDEREAEADRLWRMVRKPGSSADPDAFRDVVFVEWLVDLLLAHNPQLHPKRVYASGFSSGAGMTWMLLCYRSGRFQGFGIYSQQLLGVRMREACGDGPGNGATGYERLTGRAPDAYGFRPAPIAIPGAGAQRAGTGAVLYAHGSADDNLVHDGEPGCWAERDCTLPKDPSLAMDPGGPLQDRDDIATVEWLLARHQLSSRVPMRATILASTPAGIRDPVVDIECPYRADREDDRDDDCVITQVSTYLSAGDPTESVVEGRGEPVAWYEQRGGAHKLPAVEREPGVDTSNDFDLSVHTMRFFEEHARMLGRRQ